MSPVRLIGENRAREEKEEKLREGGRTDDGHGPIPVRGHRVVVAPREEICGSPQVARPHNVYVRVCLCDGTADG